MDIQALIDGMIARLQQERSETQLTLGQMIDKLKHLHPDTLAVGFGDLNSYRGYYHDLAFEPSDKEKPISTLLAQCQAAMGEIFHGYKGGEYQMGRNTPLWISEYGSVIGMKLVDLTINMNGRLTPVTKSDDEA